MTALAVAVVSAAVLGYEVLLMRLFAIIQWQHFAYMVISVALLGFGASGTFLAIARSRLEPRFHLVFAGFAAAFGVLALLGFALAQRVPFNALEVLWAPRQLFHLAAIYGLFVLPFFCGAVCIGLALVRSAETIGRIYFFNLLGSGIGALAVVAALFAVSPTAALKIVAGLGLAAAAMVCIDRRQRRWYLAAAVLGAAAAVLPAAAPTSWTDLRLSPFKGLSMALAVPGAERIAVRSGPLGTLAVVRSPAVPFRHAPGLSLKAATEPPEQLAVFTDGDSLSAITAFDGRLEPLAYLDYTTSALPYRLLERPAVLVLGAGGGADVLRALYHEARRIDAVELNRQMVGMVADTYAGFAGGLYRLPTVRVAVAEARSFVTASRSRWDLIQIPLLDSLAAAGGVHSLSESYIYTVEALRAYLRHLEPGGLLAITRWLKLPPRDSLRLFHTAITALEADGVDAARRLALIRGWNTTTLLVKNGPLSAAEIAAVKRFAADRSFDLAYLPGLAAAEANRSNLLDAPYFFDGAAALLGPERRDFVGRYKFDLEPATDDRPYFADFFKWRSLPELAQLGPAGAAGQFEWGYLILFSTLVQAALFSLVLIVAPLWPGGRAALGRAERGPVIFYFLALGFAFLFVEIAFIQRFQLFLGHPLYAVAVVLAAFLVFAGFGSAAAGRFDAWLGRREWPPPFGRMSAIDAAALGIAAVGLLYLIALPPLFERLIGLPEAARVGVSLVLIGPLAFCMGMPFPLGLRRVVELGGGLAPWAWGINGCASVMAAVLATILAIHFGFSAVVAIAAGLYLAAAWVFRRRLAAGAAR